MDIGWNHGTHQHILSGLLRVRIICWQVIGPFNLNGIIEQVTRQTWKTSHRFETSSVVSV
jgi:hypothetical protein